MKSSEATELSASSVNTDDLPVGFHIEQDVVSHETWTAIQRRVSTNHLPPSDTSEWDAIKVRIAWRASSKVHGRRVAQFSICKHDYINDVAIETISAPPTLNYICQTLPVNEEDHRSILSV